MPQVYARTKSLADLWISNGTTTELPRAFRAGGLVFDLHMDIGAMRDMHPHRRCTQIFQA
jgi:hypothetical protein